MVDDNHTTVCDNPNMKALEKHTVLKPVRKMEQNIKVTMDPPLLLVLQLNFEVSVGTLLLFCLESNNIQSSSEMKQ